LAWIFPDMDIRYFNIGGVFLVERFFFQSELLIPLRILVEDYKENNW
jgi:hypothetical protein